MRIVEGKGDSITCNPNEALVSAICRMGGGAAVLDGMTARCGGPFGIVAVCVRK